MFFRDENEVFGLGGFQYGESRGKMVELRRGFGILFEIGFGFRRGRKKWVLYCRFKFSGGF